MLGLIKRTIKCKTVEIMLCLYKSLVRHHVEYYSSVWLPYFKKDKFKIEQIQHRFTRMFPEFTDKPYEAIDWTFLVYGRYIEERRNRVIQIHERFFKLES